MEWSYNRLMLIRELSLQPSPDFSPQTLLKQEQKSVVHHCHSEVIIYFTSSLWIFFLQKNIQTLHVRYNSKICSNSKNLTYGLIWHFQLCISVCYVWIQSKSTLELQQVNNKEDNATHCRFFTSNFANCLHWPIKS